MIQAMTETGRLEDGVQASYQRFAELIVRECIDHAFNNGTDIDYMAKHFGFEVPETERDGNEEFRDGRDMPWAAVRWGRG